MKVIMDAHLHSRFSRATSKQITIANLEKYARIKGINLLGTGDFTHPSWLGELKENLTEDGSGILKTKSGFNFILSTEVSNIYTQDGKQRRIHNVILAPNFEIVEQINAELLKYGRLDYDGRPIFGFTCPELVEIIMSISKECMIIPAHILTPWYGVFGSKSGFDSIEECFQDQTRHIYALETGLSSDPAMDRRISSLDKYALVSFSDSHSMYPWRLARECCIFEFDNLTYKNIIDAIKKKDSRKFLFSCEVPPSFGKYHFDGHRSCDISLKPSEAIKLNNICPVCRKPLTIGVLHRVEELADRPAGFISANSIPFKSLIPLSEIIATQLGTDQLYSQKVWEEYNKLVKNFGSEFNILLNIPKGELIKITREKIANAIIKVREGRIKYIAGYDGVYGKPIFNEKEQQIYREKLVLQKSLKDF